MNEEVEQPVFATVASNIGKLASLLKEGEQGELSAGDKVRRLGEAEGKLPDLIREILNAMADTLEWLYNTSEAAESHIVVADAAIASLEVLADAIEALGEGLKFGNLAEVLPGDAMDNIGNAIQGGSQALDKGLAISGLLPRPEDLREIRKHVKACLGSRVGNEADIEGTLVQLLKAIAVPANK